MKTLLALSILASVLLLPACQTPVGQAIQKWDIAHKSQLEQSLYIIGYNVAQDAIKVFMGGASSNGKFSFAKGLQSIEGNYTSSSQISQLASTWSPNTPGITSVASVIAADLANHPPANTDQVVARIEGYVAALQGQPPAVSPPTTAIVSRLRWASFDGKIRSLFRQFIARASFAC